MDEKIELWLHDMLAAADEIVSFLQEPRNYFVFAKDIKTQRAVERNIEIIGEAMSRILKTDPEFKIANARRIVDTRNRVIHGYDTVSSSIIWAIAIKELPVLRAEIAELLKKDTGGEYSGGGLRRQASGYSARIQRFGGVLIQMIKRGATPTPINKIKE